MNIVFKPYERGVYCDDESIMYPIKPDTITHSMLAAVTISCTVIIVSFTQTVDIPSPLKGDLFGIASGKPKSWKLCWTLLIRQHPVPFTS